MNEFEYKFSLWQFDVVTDFNRTTQLVQSQHGSAYGEKDYARLRI
mgnify:CR=1 FL=1